MIKTIFGIVTFSSVLPLLLSPFLGHLIEARGSVFLMLGQYTTFESLLGLSSFLALVIFITLYRLFIH